MHNISHAIRFVGEKNLNGAIFIKHCSICTQYFHHI